MFITQDEHINQQNSKQCHFLSHNVQHLSEKGDVLLFRPSLFTF